MTSYFFDDVIKCPNFGDFFLNQLNIGFNGWKCWNLIEFIPK